MWESQWWREICHVVIWAISTTGGTTKRTKGFQQVCRPQQLCHLFLSAVSFAFFFFSLFLSVCRPAFTPLTCSFKTEFLLVATFFWDSVYFNWLKRGLISDTSSFCLSLQLFYVIITWRSLSFGLLAGEKPLKKTPDDVTLCLRELRFFPILSQSCCISSSYLHFVSYLISVSSSVFVFSRSRKGAFILLIKTL